MRTDHREIRFYKKWKLLIKLEAIGCYFRVGGSINYGLGNTFLIFLYFHGVQLPVDCGLVTWPTSLLTSFLLFSILLVSTRTNQRNIRGGSINSKTIGLFVTCDLDRISSFFNFQYFSAQ
jgi:hypothetical protein